MAYPDHYIKSGASDLYGSTDIPSEKKSEVNIQIPYLVLYIVVGTVGVVFVLLILKFLHDKCKKSKGNDSTNRSRTYTRTSTISSREQLNENHQLSKTKLSNSQTIYKTNSSSLKQTEEFENSENSSEKSDNFGSPPISTTTIPVQPRNSDLSLQDCDFSEELPLNWGSFSEKTIENEYQKLVDKYKSTTSVDSGIFASVNYELQQPASSNLPQNSQNSVNNRVNRSFGPRQSSFEAYSLNRKFSTMMTPEEAEEAVRFKSNYYQITPGDLKRLESIDDD